MPPRSREVEDEAPPRRGKVRPEEAAPTPRRAAKPPAANRAQIDSAGVLKLTTKLKKLMGKPETITMTVGEEVEIAAEYASGNIILRSREAVLEACARDITMRVPFEVLTSAVSGRGPLNLEMRDNVLLLSSARYTAELNIERAAPEQEFKPISGQDSGPLKTLLAEAGWMLQVSNMMDGIAMDVHFKWANGKIVAAAADHYHAVIVTGEVESTSSHQVTMPLALANKLSEIGGQFEIGENKVQAESDQGRAEMNQVSSSESLIPLESIRKLVKQEATWQAELSAADMLNLIGNVSVVAEGGARIEFKIDRTAIDVDSKGRHGKISGSVEIRTIEGKAPPKITVNPNVFNSVLGKASGNVLISLIGNILRIEPVEQTAWHYVGFVHIIAND